MLIPGTQLSKAEEGDEPADQLYVLLRNGEVIRGTVNRDTDHLIVKRSGTVELRIPRKQISTIGANLDSVYEYRANQIVEFHADEHLELASWCMQNRLVGPMMHHILRAETIQPDHPQLSLLKARLQQFLITSQKSADADNNELTVAPTGHASEFIPPTTQAAGTSGQPPVLPEPVVPATISSPPQESVSDNALLIEESQIVAPLVAVEELPADIAKLPKESTPNAAPDDVPEIDLPPELIKAYTARIQPLLLNRCGAGHCHGHATTSSFQLHRPPRRRNPSHELTMRNLATTLQQLDHVHPENSPLLTWGQKAHGQMRSKVLAVSNPKQKQLLSVWLKAAAVGGVTPLRENADDGNPTVVRTAHDHRPKIRHASIQWQDPARTKTAASAAAAKVSNVNKEDPFDPKSFNVEFAPKTP